VSRRTSAEWADLCIGCGLVLVIVLLATGIL
jgi:hypothetical protein